MSMVLHCDEMGLVRIAEEGRSREYIERGSFLDIEVVHHFSTLQYPSLRVQSQVLSPLL